MVGAVLVFLAFMAVAGVALQRAHADGVRAAHYARLQSTVYLLLAGPKWTLPARWLCDGVCRATRAVATRVGLVCQYC